MVIGLIKVGPYKYKYSYKTNAVKKLIIKKSPRFDYNNYY